jgi:hypothetical protein
LLIAKQTRSESAARLALALGEAEKTDAREAEQHHRPRRRLRNNAGEARNACDAGVYERDSARQTYEPLSVRIDL